MYVKLTQEIPEHEHCTNVNTITKTNTITSTHTHIHTSHSYKLLGSYQSSVAGTLNTLSDAILCRVRNRFDSYEKLLTSLRHTLAFQTTFDIVSSNSELKNLPGF